MMKTLLLSLSLSLSLLANGIVGETKRGKRPSHLRTAAALEIQKPASDRMKRRRNLAELRQASNPPQLYGPSENLYVAESLEFFQNMSPDWFEWVDSSEIQAGATTCGFLYPDLGLLPDVIYPIIQVYVCMRFANVQPAIKGNMFVHCGGPGSLSDCIDNMIGNGFFSEAILNEYNILSIDQVSYASVSVVVPQVQDCLTNPLSVFSAEWGVPGPPLCTKSVPSINFPETPLLEYREEDLMWLNSTTDFSSEDAIKLEMQKYKTRVTECWSVSDFDLEQTQADGRTVKKFHFLEYSGTRQLAQDIWTMQSLLNAPKMHLYGISYGTSVFSTFASIFPAYVGLFILDSNTSPNPDHYHSASTMAIGLNDRINYVLYSCGASGNCPVEDLRECIGDINAMLRNEGYRVGDGSSSGYIADFINLIVSGTTTSLRAEELCAAAERGSFDTFHQLYHEVWSEAYPVVDTVATSRQGNTVDSKIMSKPTSEGNVYRNPEYSVINGNLQITINIVRAQDRAGAIYDEDFFAKEVIAFGERYTGAGTGDPRRLFFAEWANGFYWPKSVPLPPAGNPDIEGIIIGLMYDFATPYVWSQEMRAAFPHTHLLTSQASNHGLGADDAECQNHVIEYLESGDVDFVDGQVCGAEFASLNDLSSIFFSK